MAVLLVTLAIAGCSIRGTTARPPAITEPGDRRIALKTLFSDRTFRPHSTPLIGAEVRENLRLDSCSDTGEEPSLTVTYKLIRPLSDLPLLKATMKRRGWALTQTDSQFGLTTLDFARRVLDYRARLYIDVTAPGGPLPAQVEVSARLLDGQFC